MSLPEGGGAPVLSRPALFTALGVLLLLGIALRLCYLDEGALFIDEGESSINALSILEQGYPSATYQGMPLFENTLTEPWPESEEYEFRDTSYSVQGKAIYHGWLPLYAIAASLALHGIRAEPPGEVPRVHYGDQEIQERIRAARLPSVFFGGLFLIAIFLLGREMFGVDAGLSAMLAGSLAPKCVWLAQQARYYSATLALSTLPAWCAWSVARRGRWRDFVVAGVVFVLLFHTSLLAFVILSITCLVLLPRVLAAERAPAKLACWAAIVTLGLLPWMLWTGFFESSGRLPMARDLLDFPADYLIYLRARTVRMLAGLAVAVLFGFLWFQRHKLPERVRRPLDPALLPVGFALAWVVLSYFGFQLLIPAASCSMARLSQFLMTAPILLSSIGLALLGRILWPSQSTLLACLASLGLLVSTDNAFRWQRRNPYEHKAVRELVDHLRGLELTPETRLYALPYQHFCLAYYTGIPIQSIAPVRREFLDRYPGEVLVLETTTRVPAPRWENIQRHAQEAGVTLTTGEARRWLPALHRLMIRAEVEPLVHAFRMAPVEEPPWAAAVVAALLRDAELPGPGHNDYSADNPAMFKGAPPMPIDDFWPTFFYRFVDPAKRTGPNLNYAGRMREASAVMLDSSWIVLRCPARPADRVGSK